MPKFSNVIYDPIRPGSYAPTKIPLGKPIPPWMRSPVGMRMRERPSFRIERGQHLAGLAANGVSKDGVSEAFIRSTPIIGSAAAALLQTGGAPIEGKDTTLYPDYVKPRFQQQTFTPDAVTPVALPTSQPQAPQSGSPVPFDMSTIAIAPDVPPWLIWGALGLAAVFFMSSRRA